MTVLTVFLKDKGRWDFPAADLGYYSGYPSRVHFCPKCFQQWAIVLRNGDLGGAEMQISRCEACGDGTILGTSNYNQVDLVLLESMGEDLVRREFELALKTFDSGDNPILKLSDAYDNRSNI
jgi:hypothetical protein